MQPIYSRTIIVLIFICCSLLAGCTREAKEGLALPSARETELLNRISDLESQLQRLSNTTVQPSPEQNDEDRERDKQLLAWYEDTLKRLTLTPKPEYEVIQSDAVESVVLVNNAPNDFQAYISNQNST